ncbi:MAG: PAS domain S-box protein [Planctomycetota bacterium]|nr:PAS domain S-box protein [Planctomycetota bacterium]
MTEVISRNPSSPSEPNPSSVTRRNRWFQIFSYGLVASFAYQFCSALGEHVERAFGHGWATVARPVIFILIVAAFYIIDRFSQRIDAIRNDEETGEIESLSRHFGISILLPCLTVGAVGLASTLSETSVARENSLQFDMLRFASDERTKIRTLSTALSLRDMNEYRDKFFTHQQIHQVLIALRLDHKRLENLASLLRDSGNVQDLKKQLIEIDRGLKGIADKAATIIAVDDQLEVAPINPPGLLAAFGPLLQDVDKLILALSDDCKHRLSQSTSDSYSRLGLKTQLLGIILCLVVEPVVRRLKRQLLVGQELREKLNRLAMVVKGTSNAVIITDIHRKITWVNDGFTKTTGYTLEEVIGKSPGALLQFEGSDRQTIEAIRETLNARKTYKGEIQNRSKDGTVYWIELLIEPTLNRAGKHNGFMAIETDVSARKDAERAMKESQQFLSGAIGALTSHIAILDSKGTVIDVNALWKDFARDNHLDAANFGIGSSYLKITDQSTGKFSEEAEDAAGGIRSVISGNREYFDLEYPCHGSGVQRWFKMSASGFMVGDERFVIVAHENITTRKIAENHLANEQSKFRSIYESASDAIMLLDSAGFFDCNKRTLQLFGIENKSQFVLLHPDDLSPKFQVDGNRSREKADRQVEIAMQEGENRFEWLHRRRDGSVFPAEVLLSSLELDGRRVLQATVRDITARKHNELQLKDLNDRLQIDLQAREEAEASLRKTTAYLDVYRLIVDQHAIVAETDVKGTITHVNDAFCRISGYSRDELLGQNHRILNSGRHSDLMWREMYKTVARGAIWHGEICNRAKNGTLYWVDTTIAPLFDDVGKVRGYFALRADITDLKNAQKQAESASLAKSEFLANMSHEIRTPMTAILGFADILAQESNPKQFPKQFEYVNTIKRNGEHLISIINDILDLSKIEAEKMIVEQIDTDLIKIVNDVLSLMHSKADAKGLKLEANFLTSIPKTIQSDPTRLRQILDNLVGNAIKFTASGGVTIEVGMADDNDNEIALSVVDTGIGIKPEPLGRLFGNFEQADASTTRNFGGSGLGLRISRKLSELLGGGLTVASEEGKGSKFTARIKANVADGTPMLEFPRDAIQLPPRASLNFSIAADPNRRILAGIRVLLAEDGVDNQRLISFYLRKAGAIVQFADNGKIAVQLMTSDGTLDGPLTDPLPFDLILSDIQMPEMDGLTSTQLLRSKGCKIPMLALTAHAMNTDAKKCLSAGCNAHLTKPIDPNLLISTCEYWTNMQNTNLSSDMKTCVSEYADDPEMAELVTEYVESFPGTVTRIKQTLEERCFEELGRIAHQLKGSGGGYGFPAISDAAAQLEADVKSPKIDSDLQQRYIQRSVEGLISILEMARASAKPNNTSV